MGELIARSEPMTFTADWILDDVLCHLNKVEDAVIVVDEGSPIGIVTTKDVFRLISAGKKPTALWRST